MNSFALKKMKILQYFFFFQQNYLTLPRSHNNRLAYGQISSHLFKIFEIFSQDTQAMLGDTASK